MSETTSRSQAIQKEYEKLLLEDKLTHFNPSTSEAWKKLTSKYGEKLNHAELKCLAQVISANLDIELSRETKRRKNMLIKWFDENLNKIWPFIEEHIEVEDVDGNFVLCKESEQSGDIENSQ